ncbi:hypothetical protein NPIL_309851 [Nephila pilipes]|uniref:Uncharacterized protein n=1 Tax=Nephila pilipes TaxID=299642 RepID=A0A8X6QE10_NEPPI|nr:hypothetical protein NPIL_309851 [Nephila pilipes]
MNSLSVATFFALVACSFAAGLYGYGYSPLTYASSLHHAPITTYATHHAAPISYAAPAVVKSASYVAPAVHAVHTPVAVAAPAVVWDTVVLDTEVSATADSAMEALATTVMDMDSATTTTRNKLRSVGIF